MTNELVKQQQQEMSLLDIVSIAQHSAISKSEQVEILRKMHYAHDNKLPLSLATTGGLFIADKRSGRVGIEAKPLKHRIANDRNYHINIIESTRDLCTLEMWRRASDLWPFAEIHGSQYELGAWIPIGRATFTMEEARQIEMYAGGSKKPLAEKDTYLNFPQEMLHYRCTQRLVSLYGDGIFSNPPLIAGAEVDAPTVIAGEVVPSMGDLIQEYGNELVLQAAQTTSGDIDAMSEWLEANQS